MRPWLVLSVTGLSFLATVALARQGSVRSKDGKMYEGDVREGQQSVVVSKGTIQVQVPRDQVASITYTGETQEVLEGRLKELKPDDLEGRLKLARDAYSGGYYDLSRQIATGVLDKDPNSRGAVDLLDLIRRQMLLEARRAAAEAGNTTGPEPGLAAPAPTPLPKAYLTDVEINLVKQAELQSRDADRVRIRFENNVARRYLALPQASPAFSQGAPFDQAMILIQTGDVNLRRDVQVVGDPTSIREFRQTVQRFVLNSCATSACHGTFAGGNFVLFPVGDFEAAAYTNFYILASYQKKGPGNDKAVFGGTSSTRKMIDRLATGRSLLLQYGLPQQIAITPHPQVEGFRPVFSSENDPQFRRIADWITNSLTAQEPVYPITYTPPTLQATTAPAATKAATRPASLPLR